MFYNFNYTYSYIYEYININYIKYYCYALAYLKTKSLATVINSNIHQYRLWTKLKFCARLGLYNYNITYCLSVSHYLTDSDTYTITITVSISITISMNFSWIKITDNHNGN